jgi:hypothetical protein
MSGNVRCYEPSAVIPDGAKRRSGIQHSALHELLDSVFAPAARPGMTEKG